MAINKRGLEDQIFKFNKNMASLVARVGQKGLNKEVQTMIDTEIMNLTNLCGDVDASNISKEDLGKAVLEFRTQTHPWFLRSPCIRRSYEKPRGYAGDYKIIDWIYQNIPSGDGIGLGIDSYFLATPGSKAMRSRKELCVHEISKILIGKSKKSSNVSLMDLGCGSGRDILEIEERLPLGNNVNCLLIDQDEEALKYSQKVLSGHKEQVKFKKLNLLRIVAGEKYAANRYGKYDVIMCIGLYDYMKEEDSIKLTRTIYSMLNDGGVAVISNWDISNPSRAELEWVCDWYLFHRSEDDMKNIVHEAGIPQSQSRIAKESMGHFNIVFLNKSENR